MNNNRSERPRRRSESIAVCGTRSNRTPSSMRGTRAFCYNSCTRVIWRRSPYGVRRFCFPIFDTDFVTTWTLTILRCQTHAIYAISTHFCVPRDVNANNKNATNPAEKITYSIVSSMTFISHVIRAVPPYVWGTI